MADVDEKEKAEKVAAARKRYEALKKQKAKKASGKKEADTKPDSDAAAASEPVEPDVTGAKDDDIAVDEDGHDTIVHRPKTGRQESHEAADSRLRSESFRRGEVNNGPLSPSIEGDAVQDIYRKQVARIEQLERDNKRLQKELDERQMALATSEKEVEELQDAQGDVTSLKAKAAKVDDTTEELKKLKSEIESLQRQNSQLTASSKRRFSTVSPPSSTSAEELSAQLATKTSSLEALELEISNLRHSLTTSSSRISELEAALATAQSTADSASLELTTLRSSIAAQSSPTAPNATKDTSQSEQLNPRIALLESDLRSATLTATSATERATTLEAKIATLTTLHRDAETRRTRDAEKAASETAALRKRLAAAVPGDATGLEELEDEERRILTTRVRELEGQVFELRRGAWRDQRQTMQPEEDGTMSPGQRFDDVDLTTPRNGSGSTLRRGSRTNGGSTNQYISAVAGGISNVFSVLTSPTRGPASYFPQQLQQQQQSHEEAPGFADAGEEDDDEFDEDAFRAAQEDAARERLERVRETKRGLDKWRGWRVDLVEARGGFNAGVFEV